MTIAIETSENIYNGTGTTAPYAYTFKIFEDSDLYVFVTSATGVVTVLTLNVDYTVTGAGSSSGGNVVPIVGSICPVGAGITIQRDLPVVQELADYTEGVAVSPVSMENSLDYLTMTVQDLKRRITARDSLITTLQAAIAAVLVGSPGQLYIINAAAGPISLPASGSAFCSKAVNDTTATVLNIVPGTAGQTIEKQSQYRDGLSSPGESVYLIYNSVDNNWYKFG